MHLRCSQGRRRQRAMGAQRAREEPVALSILASLARSTLVSMAWSSLVSLARALLVWLVGPSNAENCSSPQRSASRHKRAESKSAPSARLVGGVASPSIRSWTLRSHAAAASTTHNPRVKDVHSMKKQEPGWWRVGHVVAQRPARFPARMTWAWEARMPHGTAYVFPME